MDGTPALLANRYLLGAELGRGGMAIVYQAWDSVLNRDVAVKLLQPFPLDADARRRFTLEGETLAGLSHPGLCALHDAGLLQDRPYLVMELVTGGTLADACRPLTPAAVCALGAQLAEALAYVHARRIAHRDVKPANVLLGADGRARLADFGIARLLDEASRQTAIGTAMGTAAYLAPEQVEGGAGEPPADVYALGLVLIEALTGHAVYQGAPAVAALARLVTPPAIPAGLPERLAGVLVAMTARDPAARPSAAQVAQRLAGVPVDTMPLPTARRPPARGLAMLAVGAVAAVALLGSGLLGSGLLGAGHPNGGSGSAAVSPPAAVSPTGPALAGGTGVGSVARPATSAPRTTTKATTTKATTAKAITAKATTTATVKPGNGKGHAYGHTKKMKNKDDGG